MSKHAEGSNNEQVGQTPARPPLQVLVVENHSDTRQGLKVFLETLGCQIAFAQNRAQALTLAERQTFDVLLSDISLPDGTGWELLQVLDARGRRPAHAIAMSGLSDAADRARSREAGFEIHLVKPFRPDELEAVLHRVAASPARPTDAAKLPGSPASAEELRKRLHNGLCQHLAAAALLQGALANHLERVAATPADPASGLKQAVEECRQISRLLDEALEETLSLMRSI